MCTDLVHRPDVYTQKTCVSLFSNLVSKKEENVLVFIYPTSCILQTLCTGSCAVRVGVLYLCELIFPFVCSLTISLLCKVLNASAEFPHNPSMCNILAVPGVPVGKQNH